MHRRTFFEACGLSATGMTLLGVQFPAHADWKVDINADLKIDGLTIPKFTWAWVGINIAEGVLHGVGAGLFSVFLSNLFGGKSIEELLQEQLKLIAAAIGQKLEENDLRNYQAKLVAIRRSMEEYVNAPKSRERLDSATHESQVLLAQLESLKVLGYRSFMAAAGMRLAILQERVKLDSAEKKNLERAKELYVGHHMAMDRLMDERMEEERKAAEEQYKKERLAYASVIASNSRWPNWLQLEIDRCKKAGKEFGEPLRYTKRKIFEIEYEPAVATLRNWADMRKRAKDGFTTIGAKIIERWKV